MPDDIGWKTYERVVAAAEAESHGIEFSITPNAKLKGAISRRSRQIDILIDARWSEDVRHRTIVDAKLRRRKIDIKSVEAFLGMMEDCRPSRGILVCTSGYSGVALARAQELVTIKLLNQVDAEEYPWAQDRLVLGALCRCRSALPARHGLMGCSTSPRHLGRLADRVDWEVRRTTYATSFTFGTGAAERSL